MSSWTNRGNLTSDGQTTAWTHPGGLASVSVVGTWGSGTADLQFSPDGSNYYDVDTTNARLTADGVFDIQLAACSLRVDLSGSSSPDLNVFYQQYQTTYN